MAITKKHLKSKPVCKITFHLPADGAGQAQTAHLVGDFNGWDETATPMKKKKDGSFSVTLDLETGKAYEFRYLLDGVNWENDWSADRYAPSSFGNCDNSVVEA